MSDELKVVDDEFNSQWMHLLKISFMAQSITDNMRDISHVFLRQQKNS
jgi:hypothetical protein